MTNVFRALIESTLQTLEAGAFQDFALEFLPLLDPRFKGLARFGHTAAGKTRAGTPDLLKTDPATGAQIAVQCGTDADYWSQKEPATRIKPVKDALKCIEALINLSEIVLISNRPVPTSAPDVRSDIIGHLRRPHTAAPVTLLSLEDVGQFLATSLHALALKPLIQRYFPEVAAAVVPPGEATRYRIAISVSQQRPVDAATLFRVVDEAVHTLPDVNKAREYVVERLDQFARCRLSAPPPFAGLRRESVASLPLATPFGKVWLLVGVPKIGKTSVLQQLMSHYPPSEVRWFDVPLDADDCAEEIIAELKHTFTAGVVPPSRPTVAGEPGESPESFPRTLFVIDNAHHLSSRGLRRLAEGLQSVRRGPSFLQSTCIFVSTMALPLVTPVIDSVVLAPLLVTIRAGLTPPTRACG